MDFVCPICGGELAVCESLIKRCPSGHSFDRARAGYYNLLPSGSGGVHGDNADMVSARRAFLSAGYYEPLQRRIVETALKYVDGRSAVLDIGAGEGYYTAALESALYESCGECDVLAFDISKDAVKALAKRAPRVKTAVASAYSMPVGTAAIDLAMLVFSPLAREEILRVLAPRAKFLMVFPDDNHLFGLKSAIYKTPYKNTPMPTELEGFTLLSDESLSYSITLSGRRDIESLFMMTPYAYRTSREDRERLLSLDTLTTEVAFRILVYEKSERS